MFESIGLTLADSGQAAGGAAGVVGTMLGIGGAFYLMSRWRQKDPQQATAGSLDASNDSRVNSAQPSKTLAGTSGSGKPRFKSKETNGQNTYEVFTCEDREAAKRFLETREVKKPLYYLIVETPHGNWGKDIDGLFLERLLPWQRNTSDSNTTGRIWAMSWSGTGLAAACRGHQDNFVVRITCEACDKDFVDGVQYQASTVVDCPHCRARCLVDSSNIHAIGVGA